MERIQTMSFSKEESNLGYFDLDVPRDREGSFELEIVKKYETDVLHLESSIIEIDDKGMTTRYIESQVNEIYGMNISPTKVIPMIREW